MNGVTLDPSESVLDSFRASDQKKREIKGIVREK